MRQLPVTSTSAETEAKQIWPTQRWQDKNNNKTFLMLFPWVRERQRGKVD